MLMTSITGLVRRGNGGGKWWRIRTLNTVVMLIVLHVGVVLYVREEHPFLDKTFAYEVVMSSVFLGCKLGWTALQAPTFLDLVQRSDRLWAQMAQEPENHPILLKERKRLKGILKLLLVPYVIPTPLTFVLYLLHSFQDGVDRREPMFKFCDPVDMIFGEEYVISRVVCQLVMVCYCLGLYGVGAFVLLYFSWMAASLMKVLSRMLEDGCHDMRTCLRLHQECTRFAKDINELYSGVMAIELLANGLVISLRAYIVISLMKAGDPRFLGELIFLTTTFTDPFIICYSGQALRDMSEDIYRKSYQGRWYELSLRDKRSLALMMTRASRPLIMSYRHTVTFDMMKYASVFQAAYSYITILVGM